MKRAGFVFAVMIVLALAVSISFNARNARAQTINYDITSVNHEVEVLYNGYVLLNDTVRINITGQAPSEFLVGFPHKYGSYVLRSIAYDTANPSTVFSVDLNVPLDGHIGYYGAKINFPLGAPETFTIAFVLSSNLLAQSPVNGSTFTLDFPAYPSLTKTAAICNSSIVLPRGTTYIGGTVGPGFVYRQENLTAFTYQPANVTFMATGGKIRLVDVNELKREIRINELGEIHGSDTYRITNKEPSLDSIQVILPPNASAPSASDQFGRPFTSQPALIDQETSRYVVTLAGTLDRNESTMFTVSYRLPSGVYLKQQGDAYDFALTFPLFQNLNYFIEAASTSFVLPEGGQIKNLENVVLTGDYSVSRGVFQESVSIGKDGVVFLDNSNVEIAYTYNPLWLSFRPTLWIWAVGMVGVAIAVFWRRPAVPVSAPIPTVAVRLTTESLKSFVDAYDEKRKITSELASLEARVQKGRIPRRRYKVQKVTLETRLSALSRNLTELKERLHSAGGKYAELIHQLEIAETEITEVEANMKSIESRHGRGEISLEAYRKLLADYQSRREKAETAISGILLRFREEIG